MGGGGSVKGTTLAPLGGSAVLRWGRETSRPLTLVSRWNHLSIRRWRVLGLSGPSLSLRDKVHGVEARGPALSKAGKWFSSSAVVNFWMQSSGPIVCLLIHSSIHLFIHSFIIICVLSTCCADAVFISGEREKNMTGTAPDLMDLTSPRCPLAASPQRTDQAIAALRATLVAQSMKGPQVAPESTWQVSPGRCPGAAGWGWVGVRGGRSRHWSGCFTSPSLTRRGICFFSVGEISDFSSAPGGHIPSQPLLQRPGLGGILPPITCDPRKEHSRGSGNLCGDTSSVGPLVSELLSGPLLPCSPPS